MQKTGSRTAGKMQMQLFWLPGLTGLVIKKTPIRKLTGVIG
jgi:hypothetical protein